MKVSVLRKALFIASLLIGILCQTAFAGSVYYVAPEKTGSGDGGSSKNAAHYLEPELWDKIQNQLASEPVTVKLVPGSYSKEMFNVRIKGNPDNRLTIEGLSPKGAIFEFTALNRNENTTGFHIRGTQNVTVRDLHFTGPGHCGYASSFNGKNIIIENCSWVDMPNIRFGAAGSSRDTRQVLYQNCVFKRIGLTGGAHMSYNAYGPQYLHFIDSHFEDCAGDYIRFRDRTDYCLVENCTFVSTGTWPPADAEASPAPVPGHRVFIAVPLFADGTPPGTPPGDEWFGTHFVIRNNTFIYKRASWYQFWKDDTPGTRISFRILHKGYDPPDLRHLPTPEEGKILESGSVEERKALFKQNMNLDMDEIYIHHNRYRNVESKGAFYTEAAYGAVSNGWEGQVFIYDLIHHEPILPDWIMNLQAFSDSR